MEDDGSVAARAARRVEEALRDLDRRQYPRAGKALDEAIALCPDRVDYAVHRARVTYHAGIGHLGRMREAETQLEACLARDPDLPLAHRYLGLIAWHTKRPDAAERAWLRCLEIAPDDPVAQQGLRDLARTRSLTRRGASWVLGKLIGKSY